jgi:hypothetical protein
MRKIIIALVVLVLFAGGGFAWYYFQGPCGTIKVDRAATELLDADSRFTDAFSIANATPRISLDGPLGELQEIRRDTVRIQVPACLENAQEILVGSMETTIDGFIAFMNQESDTEVTMHFVNAGSQLGLALDEIEAIKACAPTCRPDPHRFVP